MNRKEDEGASNSVAAHEKHNSPLDAEQQVDNFDELSLEEKPGNS